MNDNKMLNIFNLFLFLLSIWVGLMALNNNFSWLYLFFGLIFSFIVAFSSFKLSLIKENSELLYLSLGFYRYFIKLYLQNFAKSLRLISFLSFSAKPIIPLFCSIKNECDNKFNPALLISSINMHSGLTCANIKDNIFYIHAIDKDYFDNFNLYKAQKLLPMVNDDNLV